MPSSTLPICNQRIGIKRTRPNPLFEEWLEELYELALNKNSKLTPMLKEALNSISKYPLPLKSGAECAILKGFEKRLCKMLDLRLAIYNSDNLRSQTSDPSLNHEEALNVIDNEINKNLNQSSSSGLQTNHINENRGNFDHPSISQLQAKSVINNVSNFPQNESTNKAFNDNVASSHTSQTNGIKGTLKKQIKSSDLSNELSKHSQENSTINNNVANAVSHISQTNVRSIVEDSKSLSKATLKKNGLSKHSQKNSIIENGACCHNSQTNQARNSVERPITLSEVDHKANELPKLAENNAGPSYTSQTTEIIDSPTSSSEVNDTQSSNIDIDMIELPPGTFEVILLIDKNEISGASKKNDPTVTHFKKYTKLKHEYRSLKVGDFIWIARSKSDKSLELVLPYVVERKRMDDFGSSIKDGRFHEQKFRLRKCGLGNVIYLVENHGRNKHVGLPITTLMQALANTGVQDEFKIHMTDSLLNSCRFLAIMTKRLTLEYKNQHLKGSNSMAAEGKLMTFDYFNKNSSKTKPLTVKQTFIKLLLQLRGVSVDKALAITDVYATPAVLMKAYQCCPDQKDAAMLLANLKYGNDNRNVGPTVSKALYHLFSLKPT